jgi:alpha-tubulin suppressor-like RCC1 family protein
VVVNDDSHTLALADDGSVYAWGKRKAKEAGTLGLSGEDFEYYEWSVPTPQRVPKLRVACGL